MVKSYITFLFRTSTNSKDSHSLIYHTKSSSSPYTILDSNNNEQIYSETSISMPCKSLFTQVYSNCITQLSTMFYKSKAWCKQTKQKQKTTVKEVNWSSRPANTKTRLITKESSLIITRNTHIVLIIPMGHHHRQLILGGG